MAEAAPSIHPRPSVVIAVLAKQAARNAVKAELRARGLKLSHFAPRDLSIMANEYLDQHCAELFAETWQRVQNSFELRKLYDREQRKLER